MVVVVVYFGGVFLGVLMQRERGLIIEIRRAPG